MTDKKHLPYGARAYAADEASTVCLVGVAGSIFDPPGIRIKLRMGESREVIRFSYPYDADEVGCVVAEAVRKKLAVYGR